MDGFEELDQFRKEFDMGKLLPSSEKDYTVKRLSMETMLIQIALITNDLELAFVHANLAWACAKALGAVAKREGNRSGRIIYGKLEEQLDDLLL